MDKCRTCLNPSFPVYPLDVMLPKLKYLESLYNLLTNEHCGVAFPQVICSTCYEILDVTSKFIQQVKNTNEHYIRQSLTTEWTLDENKIDNDFYQYEDCLEEVIIDIPKEADLNNDRLHIQESTNKKINYNKNDGYINYTSNSISETLAKNQSYDERLNESCTSDSKNVKSIASKDKEHSKEASGKEHPNAADHSRIQKVNDRFLCYVCNQTFSVRKDVVRHINSLHTDEAHYQCEFCGKQFKRKDKVRHHIKTSHKANFASDVKTLTKGTGYIKRVRNARWKFGDRLYTKPTKRRLIECKLCKEPFKNSKELRKHFEMHCNTRALQDLQVDSEIMKELYPNFDTGEQGRNLVSKSLASGQWSRYYVILNEFGYEVSISDTEDEEDTNIKLKSPYECELCGESYCFKNEIYTHMKQDHRQYVQFPHKCNVCKLSFVCSRMYEKHSQTHCRNKDKILMCTKCPGRFVWLDSLEQHDCLQKTKAIKNVNNSFKCSVCKAEYQTKLNLESHLKTHTEGKPSYRCGLCPKRFLSLKLLRNHMPVHKDGKTEVDYENSLYVKSFVQESFTSAAALGKEIQQIYRQGVITRFYCAVDKDGKELVLTDSESDSEFDTNLEQYSCAVCLRKFHRRTQLFNHQNEDHTNTSLPHRCEFCFKEFAAEALLMHHLTRNCLNDYQQQCDRCPSKFVWPENLLMHQQIKHRDSFPKSTNAHKLKCEECDKVFIWHKDLKRHRSIHRPEEKNFVCPHCPRRFYRKDNLLSHKRIHASKAGSALPSFSRKVCHFDVNLSKRHGYKHIKCMICYSVLSTIKDLRNHLIYHQTCISFEGRRDSETIDYISQQLYPDEEPMAESMLIEHIKKDLSNQLTTRFYSITNEQGYELSLDSSETDDTDSDDDSDSCEVVKQEICKKAYKCDLCPYLKFMRKCEIFKHHQLEHSWEDGRHVCSTCHARFISAELLKHHSRRQCKNLNKRFQCRRCNMRFMWKCNLQNHLNISHLNEPSSLPRQYDCFLCRRKFEQNDDLTAHLNRHNNPNSTDQYCVLCRRMFHCRENFEEHIKSHGIRLDELNIMKSIISSTCWPNGVKIIKCKICNHDFTTMTDLAEHFTTRPSCAASSSSVGLAHYSITNEQGFELHLEFDSETEPEECASPSLSTKPSYTCELCNFQCKRKYEMSRHQRSRHRYEEMTLKCEKCIFKTACQRILVHHQNNQCFNNEKTCVCSICTFRFMWSENLFQHIKIHHSEKNQNQSSVKIEEMSTQSVDEGFPATESANIYKCDKCQRTYNRSGKDCYEAHVQQCHRTANDHVLTEKYPLKVKPKPTMKQKHLCFLCGLGLSSSSNLVVHMRRHTGEKPYKCDMCDYAFARHTDLITHRRTHTGERPYKCTICPKSFIRSYKLTIHMRTHTGERPYKCTLCKSAFAQSNDLVIHKRRHTGERPYVCDICGEGFIQSTALKVHRQQKGHHDNHNNDENGQQSLHLPPLALKY